MPKPAARSETQSRNAAENRFFENRRFALASNSFAPVPVEKTITDSSATNTNSLIAKVIENPPKKSVETISTTPKKKLSEKDSFVGSKDFGLTGETPKQPNFNVNIMPPKTLNDGQNSVIAVEKILSINGINADFENGKWKVKSVAPNSLGESSGIKQNDVIEAVDDLLLSGKTIKGDSFKGKELTITRDGERKIIKLQNK